MTVVLIHGMFTNPNCWSLVDKLLLDRGITAHKISLHPAGVSKRGRGFEAVTASVLSQIHGINSQPLVLVGHSLASLIVEKILTTFPLAVPVLVNPSPGWGFFGPLYPLWVGLRRGRFWNDVVDLNENECRKLLFQGMSAKKYESVREIIEPESGELVRQAFWFFDLFGAATRIRRLPNRDIFAITGALDPMGTPAYAKQLITRYGSDSRIDVVENVGHMSILQEAGAQMLVKRIAGAYEARQYGPALAGRTNERLELISD